MLFGREYTKHMAELDADPSAAEREVERSRELANQRWPLVLRIAAFMAAAAFLLVMIGLVLEFVTAP